MRPFDPPTQGDSGTQIDFDTRRVRYLECLAVRAFLKSTAFDRWKVSKGEVTLCDAVAALGLRALDPGLESVRESLAELPPDEQTSQLRDRLKGDDRHRSARTRHARPRAPGTDRRDLRLGPDGNRPRRLLGAAARVRPHGVPARHSGLRRERAAPHPLPAGRDAGAPPRPCRVARSPCPRRRPELPGRRGRAPARHVHGVQVLVRRSVPMQRVRGARQGDPRAVDRRGQAHQPPREDGPGRRHDLLVGEPPAALRDRRVPRGAVSGPTTCSSPLADIGRRDRAGRHERATAPGPSTATGDAGACSAG